MVSGGLQVAQTLYLRWTRIANFAPVFLGTVLPSRGVRRSLCLPSRPKVTTNKNSTITDHELERRGATRPKNCRRSSGKPIVSHESPVQLFQTDVPNCQNNASVSAAAATCIDRKREEAILNVYCTKRCSFHSLPFLNHRIRPLHH